MANEAQAIRGHKRLNFFRGFLTTEQDWNEGEAYHRDKRRQHNRLCHAPGVVRDHGGELRVVARGRGDLSFEVLPGHAIDGRGNELWLPDGALLTINPDDYRLPQTLYVVLRFHEELTDFIAYKEHQAYKGHRRVLETARVEVIQTVPELEREVELARIELERGADELRDARELEAPRRNELDLRWVPWAGVAGSRLAPATRRAIAATLTGLRASGLGFARLGLRAGHEVAHGVATAQMLGLASLIDRHNVFEVFALLVDAQAELVAEIEVGRPELGIRRELGDLRRQLEVLRGALGDGRARADGLELLLGHQRRASQLAAALLADEHTVAPAPARAAFDLIDWDPIKVTPQPAATLEVAGVEWVLVDEIALLDKASEERHELVIRDAKDSYRTRQKLRYPDGTLIEDSGRAHVSGYTQFRLHNLSPGRPLVLLRRMDYVYGDYEVEYAIGGKAVATAACPGTDRVHRWRNWPVLFDAAEITQETALVRQTALSAERDVNLFHLWAYQPR